ncbi:outer membrane usher protein [Salmonella enterica]|uniref:Outer membrane usher protein n=1 Tax=Salmonella enterica TaxID=28901 RepID=A0A5V1ADQ8_SALER|nr:outer membrane usher protein [Salmonella enterica]EDG0478347.1 outer membrane usher protein [Salmonella enterica subsp. enterica serovar Newport]EDS5051532.1 outer membrane usher protein [Salmonella enterica subsp. enterica serovar Javiana]EFT0778421.1 outer membrane usher protein [Salmonella enterica subsp. enterica serovar Amager]EAN1870802.1 outer membrane usher protein [Salmonella enterica]EAS5177663.1 outer membrane usher protein [Salmonella enterica]
MAQHVVKKAFRLCCLRVLIALSLVNPLYTFAVDDIQFNTDVLDVKDRTNLDLSRFARSGYIMPGTYMLSLRINQQELPERAITFAAPVDDPQDSIPCLTQDIVGLIGLKRNYLKTLAWRDDGLCLDNRQLAGWVVRGDLSQGALILSIPQAYLEYSAPDWDPPSRWDEGIPALLLDYSLNFTTTQYRQQGRNNTLSGNGTTGFNIGPWRLRADWQMQQESRSGGSDNRFDWSRFYAFRAIPALMASLTLGENYLNSDIFDSFRFSGVTLNTDDNMLPPNLRGYAPEVVGVAKTNARVVISQQGRVLYDTQVAPGPFRIQDLNDAVSGKLKVRVEEQDGTSREFSVDTASIPYLTRPGRMRYKLTAGRPTDWNHKSNGPLFSSGEFSWGISNGWSLYGGGIGGEDYHALALGIGRDLTLLGALSFDVTRSDARLPQEGSLQGISYRLSYSKRFEDYDSQVTFAGYRFSERDYMSMGTFLGARDSGWRPNSGKEMYTITFNKQFARTSLYLNYNHQTYWNAQTNDSYTLSVARYFDVGRFKDLNLSFNAYHNKYQGTSENGMYLSLSLPWGDNGNISYSGQTSRHNNTHSMSYFGRNGNDDNWQISAGGSRDGALANGYFTHRGSMAEATVNASYQANRYHSAGASLQGGITVTSYGAALHRMGTPGGTRILVDTGDASGVPLRGFGALTRTNMFGKAVVSDVNSYYRNQISIDVDALADNMETMSSVKQATLTQGAIGYRQFEVLTGGKAMVVIRQPDGASPPFGAQVKDLRGREVGVVNDDGSAWLSGLQPNGRLQVFWNGGAQCELHLPQQLSDSGLQNLLLPCLAQEVSAPLSEEVKQ